MFKRTKSVCMISALMAAIMLFASFPQITFASQAATETVHAAESAQIVSEDVSLRTEFSKHFILSDGSFMAVSYPEAVHVKHGDAWEEVDNSISGISTDGLLKTGNDSFPVSFAASAGKDHMVSINKDGHELAWNLKAISNNTTVSGSGSAAAAVRPQRKSADLTEVANAAGEISYAGVFGSVQDVSVKYTVMQNKLEEDIILNEPGNITAFCMDMYTNGLTAQVNPDNSISLLDGDELVYNISPPYMCDAVDEVLNDFTIALQEIGSKLRITYTPCEGWLNDPARAYPVLFDPAITTSEYNSGLIDTYVLQGNTAAHDSEQKIYAGIKSGKLCRSYIKITSLPAIPAGMPITGAELYVRNTTGSSTGRQFSLYKVTSSWSPSSITYANQPSIGALLDTDSFDAADLVNSFSLSKDISSFYSEMFAGNNYGYMIRYTSESTTNPDYNAFYSSEFTTKASRPYIKIYYSYARPSCLGNNAVYSLKNAASGKNLSVYGGIDANGTNVCQLTGDSTTKQQFKLEMTSEGACLLRAKCSSNGTNRVLDIAKSGGYVQDGGNVQLYTNVDEIAQEWFIFSVGTGFKIVPRTNMSLALTAVGTANGTASGKSAGSAGNVCVSVYTGSSSQIWYFYNTAGTKIYQSTSPYLEDDTYYINNASTGKYAKQQGTLARTASGTLSNLGSTIKWKVTGIGNGQHVIRPAGDTTKYLAGSSQLLDPLVSIVTVSGSTVPNNCRWTVNYDDGITLTNVATGYVLCDVNGDMRAYPSSSATNKQWRVAPVSFYGNTSACTLRELSSSFSVLTLTINVSESKAPIINKTPVGTTVAWANASDFVYSGYSSSIIKVDALTGSITGLKNGSTSVTATHKVTGLTSSFLVNVSKLTIYQTEKTYYEDGDGNRPEDILNNKMTMDELCTVGGISSLDFTYSSPANYESNWRTMCKNLFATDPLESVILDMVDHFMAGSGGSYSNATLTTAARNHGSTKEYVSAIETQINQLMKIKNGDMSSLSYTASTRKDNPLVKVMQNKEIQQPVFNTPNDKRDRLTICVNGLWGNKIEVSSYNTSGNTFTCTLHYTLYDHFGLDREDLDEYGVFAGFRSWYILQHYAAYNGAYKPFLTLMEFDVTFSGTIS